MVVNSCWTNSKCLGIRVIYKAGGYAIILVLDVMQEMADRECDGIFVTDHQIDLMEQRKTLVVMGSPEVDLSWSRCAPVNSPKLEAGYLQHSSPHSFSSTGIPEEPYFPSPSSSVIGAKWGY
jgi:hypothetical protein